MSVEFKAFRDDLIAWLATQPQTVSKHFPSYTYRPLFRIGKDELGGGTYFDEQEIFKVVFNGDQKQKHIAVSLAQHLNKLYGGKGTPPQPPPPPEKKAVPYPPSPPPQPAQASEEKRWRFPQYDYSRAEEVPEWGGVRVNLRDDEGHRTLSYSWPEEDGKNVYRVITSDDEEPYNPDDFDESAIVEVLFSEDSREATSPYRFVTVWAYPKVAADDTLGQPRLIARTLYVYPLRNWNVAFVDGAAVSQWQAIQPVFGKDIKVDVARLPEGQSPVKLIRTGMWLNHCFDNDGTGFLKGFQDSDVQEGRTYTYVAAVRVSVDDQELYSAITTKRYSVKATGPRPVGDLEAILREPERDRWRLEWTAPATGEVLVYRTRKAPTAGAVERPEIPYDGLEDVGLSEGDRVNKHPAPVLGPDGKQIADRWYMDSVTWVEGDEWDAVSFTPVTRIGDRCSIGTPVTRLRSRSITGARVVQRMNWQRVTFEWPGNAVAVKLHRTHRGESFSPDTPVEDTIDKEQYRIRGGFALKDPLPAEGAGIHLTSVSYYKGESIGSLPISVEVPPLWGFVYAFTWPYIAVSKIKKLLGNGLVPVTVEVASCSGKCPPAQVATLVLVYNEDRLPLSAEDGKRIPMYMQKEGNELREERWSIEAPREGGATVYFNARANGVVGTGGYFRLMVAALPESAKGASVEKSLQRYALVDPPISDLRNR